MRWRVLAFLAAAILAPLLCLGAVSAQQSTGDPSPPSALIGSAPPLPLSLPTWRRLQNNPDALRQMQSALPAVVAKPAPAPPPLSPWQLAPSPAGNPLLSNPLLLTDGTVIAHVSCSRTWWRLTPDNTGSYVNGTWSQIASLPSGYEPRFFSSAVLPDGRVIAEGGEYNNAATPCANGAVWTNLGAIYDPKANTWTSVTPPSGMTNIGDAQASVLADGTYMQGDSVQILAARLNPTTLAWTSTGTGKADSYDEEGWTLLPDGTVLTVDAYVTGTCAKGSERYDPTTGAWTSAGNTPSQLPDCSNPGNSPSFEMGPHALRPDGTVVALGGTLCSDVANASCASGALSTVTHSAIFNSTTLAWAAGPDIPAVSGKNYSLADAPAAVLPSGNILFAASPNYQGFVTPTHFFELDGTTNAISQVADPTDAASFTAFEWNFLVLPTGQIMALETDGSNVWIYTPSGSAKASWLPVISSVPTTLVPGATYQVQGSQLNGLSQGAYYGDDVQGATNYPIVKVVNTASGHVFYGRTVNFSAMSVAPNATSSANFTLPASIETGASQLSVIANGIASQAVAVTINSGTTHNLSITSSGNGTVTSTPSGINCGPTCSAAYADGTQITLTAAAQSGSTFTGWSGACSGTGQCAVTLSSDVAVTATFGVNNELLTVTNGGNGTVTSDDGRINCGATCSASYANGVSVTLTATPASGFDFTGWSGACSGTGDCLLTMTGAKNVSATFMSSAGGGPTSRTWVSAAGDDANDCSHTAPCLTFAGAIAKTSPGGEIDCVDAGSFGTVTITFAVTIDCGSGDTNAVGAISAGTATVGTAGIKVQAGADDVVTLRKVSINGQGTGNAGIDFLSGKTLELENVRVMHFARWGIVVEPNSASSVTIVDSIVSDCGSATASHGDIWVQPQGGASLTNVSLKNARMLGGANGLVVDDSNSTTIHASVDGSLAAASLGDGFLAETTGGRLTMLIDHSTAANNGLNGVEAVGANTEVHVGNSRLYGNSASTSISGGGPTLLSYGNNEIDMNGRNAAISTTRPQ